MKDAAELDFVIIGQGLAGSALAMRAIARDYKVLVLDKASQNRSSLIAAGLFNPVTGPKMTKTWMADALFPALFRYYREVEALTGERFFHETPIHRPFVSQEEQNAWMARTADHSYAGYIDRVSATGIGDAFVREPFGGVTLRQAGYVDTDSYLRAVRRFLRVRGAYRDEHFDATDLRFDGDSVLIGNMRAKKVIFCQGVENRTNPWFNGVPVNSLKGEFISIQCTWEKSVILNRGVYMVPGRKAGEWRVGSTYDRNDHRPEVTSSARNQILGKLEAFFSMPYTITGQDWGVRPTSPDRRPIIGAHPQHQSLVIFNGLGTKGVSLAPYFSEVLIRWVENEGTIDKEADISRFY